MTDFIQVNIQIINGSPYPCEKESFRAKMKLDDRVQSLAKFLSGYIDSQGHEIDLKFTFQGKILQMERRVKDYAEVFGLDLRSEEEIASTSPICLGTFDWKLTVSVPRPNNDSLIDDSRDEYSHQQFNQDVSQTQSSPAKSQDTNTKPRDQPSETPNKPQAHQSSNPTFKKYIELATSQFITGMHLNALKNFQRALDLDLSNPQMTNMVASINMMVGFLHSLAGRAEKSQDFYQKGLELFFGSLGVKSPLTAGVTCNIGNVLLELGDHLQALDFYKSASDIVTGLISRQSGEQSKQNSAVKQRTGDQDENQESVPHMNTEQRVALEWPISYNLAVVQHCLKNYGLSLEVCKRALELALAVWGETDTRVGDVFQLISDNLLEMGLKQDSLEFLEKALKIYQENLDDQSHLKLLNCREKRCATMLRQQDADRTRTDLVDEIEEILSEKVRLLGESSVLVADSYFNLGKMSHDQGEIRSGVAYWRKAFGILSKHLEEYLAEASAVGLGSATGKGNSGDRLPIGESRQSQTLNSHQELLTSARGQKVLTRLLKVLHLLITIEYNQGKFDQVEELVGFFNQKLDLGMLVKPQSYVVKAGGQEVLNLLKTVRFAINGIAPMLLLNTGKNKQAYAVATQGVEDCKREFGETHPKTYAAFFKLGWVCFQLGGEKSSEAALYFSLIDQAAQESLPATKPGSLLADPQFQAYRPKLAELLASPSLN